MLPIRFHIPLFVFAALALLPLSHGPAMSNGTLPTLTVECLSDDPKAPLPEAWCTLFAERLAAAYPGFRVERGEPGTLIARLVAEHASARRFEARLVWLQDGAETAHPPLGTARMDGDLDGGAVAEFLDHLIAQSPAP